MTTTVPFATTEFFDAMTELLDEDPKWQSVGSALTYSIVFDFGEPVHRRFFVRFDQGRIVDTNALGDEPVDADFVIAAPASTWRALFEKRVNPTTAMMRGQFGIEGKMSTLLKHMKAFTYVIDSMSRISVVYPDAE